jgi:predicted nucleotidyltransferase
VSCAFAERTIADYFRDTPGVAAVYLFGSVAKGTARADSDLDIGVLYQSPRPRTLMAQPFAEVAELSECLARPVQVVVMNQAPTVRRPDSARD